MSVSDRRGVPLWAKTVPLAVALLSSGVLVLLADLPGPPAGTTPVPLLVLTAVFLVAGLGVLDVEVGDRAYGLTVTQVPLVLGLVLADPATLLVARALGQLLTLVLLPRQSLLKVALNAALSVGHTSVAVALVAVLGRPDPTAPASWPPVLAAVLFADLLSHVVVHVVTGWTRQQRASMPVIPLTAVGSAVASTCVGTVAVLLLPVHPAALAVLAVPVVLGQLALRAHLSLQHRHRSLRLLHDVTVALGTAVRPDQAAEALLHHARQLLRARVADVVVLRGDESEDLRITLQADAPLLLGAVEPHRFLPLWEVAGGDGVLQPRGGRSPAEAHLAAVGCRDGLVAAVRLDSGDRLLLTVGGRTGDVRTFDDEDRRTFLLLTEHAARAMDAGRLMHQLRAEAERRAHQALHDQLTGLPNRRHFTERAEAALTGLSPGRRLAVVLLDLDGFKEVNDTLGHATGDDLLREVGRRLQAVTRHEELAARLGGDEFALLLDLGPGEESAAVVERITRAVEQPVPLAGMTLQVRASAGTAVSPEDGTGLDELQQHADDAMYQRKQRRRGGALASTPSPTTASRTSLARELRRAIDAAELVVHYQPAADLRSGRITGAEALVRWQHPVHGRLGPAQFIPVAEQAGLITELTYEVLRTTLADAAAWARSGHTPDLSVNVAARTLVDPSFPDHVLALLAASGTAPSRLVLDVSESGLMADADRSGRVLSQLAQAGVGLALDDVGTGLTSLARLGSLPLTELKVDGRFVRSATADPRARTVLQSARDLATGLGLRLVAEGVENQLTWDLLLTMGCDRGQGWFLSPPLAPEDLHAWLVQRAAVRRALPAGT